jgi:ABC-type phosphate transport system substrate-binding protein
MKIRNTIMSLCLLAGFAISADWVVVANPAVSVTSISKADLKRIYTGKKTQLGSGKVVPVMLTETNPAAASFLTEVLGMSGADYKRFWVDAQIKGEGTAPMTQKSSGAAVGIVSEIPGGIAIVEKSAANASVKVLDVK